MWKLTAFALMFLVAMCLAQSSEGENRCQSICQEYIRLRNGMGKRSGRYKGCNCDNFLFKRSSEKRYANYRDQYPDHLLRDYMEQYEDMDFK